VASESELAIQESRFVPTVNPPAARPSTRCVNAVLQAIALGARYVSLVFHVEHTQAPTPEVIESNVVRQGPVRQWR
jgi:hypothetical protein